MAATTTKVKKKKIPLVLKKAVRAHCRYEASLRSDSSTSKQREHHIQKLRNAIREVMRTLPLYTSEREVHTDVSAIATRTHCKR